jgi:hypothetical protein
MQQDTMLARASRGVSFSEGPNYGEDVSGRVPVGKSGGFGDEDED